MNCSPDAVCEISQPAPLPQVPLRMPMNRAFVLAVGTFAQNTIENAPVRRNAETAAVVAAPAGESRYDLSSSIGGFGGTNENAAPPASVAFRPKPDESAATVPVFSSNFQ